MSIKIALAGNPNCGKTTLFNALTGANQFVGNWPGVTVEKKEGRLKEQKNVTVVDLPGIYSLSPYTPEEIVARNYLIGGESDVIINIVDGTNIERNLYLSAQLMELGIPVVMAVNMMDIVEKSGDVIHIEELRKSFGCEVAEISALKGKGIREAAGKAIEAAQKKAMPLTHTFAPEVEAAIRNVSGRLPDIAPDKRRFFAVKLLEKDDKIAQQMTSVPDVSDEISTLEERFDNDTESIFTNERYDYIASVIAKCYKKANQEKLTASDKIDKIITHRILALPIFAAVMFLVYYIAMVTVGAFCTDWTNDVLFGEIVPEAVDGVLSAIGCGGFLYGLIQDGIVAGVGAVLGFIPQMLVLFLLLSFLEDCGYMARIAFIMDRLFYKFGLSGKSFIPMLVGVGCGVPGIMASRTIGNDRDRKMTIMTTTFIPCSAKMPIVGLIAGALFGGAAWVATSAYFVGVAAIVISGIILKKTRMFAGDPASFVMELPAYHMPTAGSLLRSMWERGWSFIKKAGTIILLSTILLWFLMNFGWNADGFGMLDFEGLEGLALEEAEAGSILAKIGSGIAWIFTPLGFGDWKMAVASLTGLIAKENVVSTFGVLFGVAEAAGEGNEIWAFLAAGMTQTAAYSFLVFNLLCAPCFAAMGAIRREMNNRKWFLFAIGYQCLFAYVISLCVYRIGAWIFEGAFGAWTIVAFLLAAGVIFLLVRPHKQGMALRVSVGKKMSEASR